MVLFVPLVDDLWVAAGIQIAGKKGISKQFTSSIDENAESWKVVDQETAILLFVKNPRFRRKRGFITAQLR